MAATEGLKVALHPLPILNVSEHLTRVSLQQNNVNVRIVGGLLGTQLGRDIEIMNTFELVVEDKGPEQGGLQVDHGYFVTRAEQFKQVFPTFDFLGWYSVGDAPSPEDVELHQQFFTYNETPLFMQLSRAPAAGSGKDLPVTVYESTMEIVDSAPQVVFRAVDYEIETGEAERVAVDHASKASTVTEGGQSGLIANLTTQRNALQMLHDRVAVIVQYLSAVSTGAAPQHDETLRHISALVSSLQPTTTLTDDDGPSSKSQGGGGDLKDEFLTEYNDVLLTTYLATLTKQLSSTNMLLDKQLLAVSSTERGTGGGGRGGAGQGSNTTGGGGGRRAGKSVDYY